MHASAKHFLALAFAATLAACANPRHADDVTGSVPDDYRLRHPVTVTSGHETMDLLPGGGPAGLTDRQVGDIQAFADKWRKAGRGPITIEVPTGGAADIASARSAKEIRRIFAVMGIPHRASVVTTYPAEGPGHLAPVRLEYPVLEAKVPHPCGQWPDDMGYSDPGSSNRNRTSWNFGCATQQNLAASVEDPEDFIRPRSEDPPSATRRADVLRKYGKGEATATSSAVSVEGTTGN
jgi:pilus assembly protein CpaD